MTLIGYGVFIKGKMIAFYEDKEKCFTVAGVVMPVYVEHKILNVIIS